MTLLRWQWLGRVMLDGRLPASAKVVAFWMCEHANKALLTAFPGVEIERKPGPHGTARYKLSMGLTVLPLGCADLKAAIRAFNPKERAPNGKGNGVTHDTNYEGNGVTRDTNYEGIGVTHDTRTSSQVEHRISHHHRQDGDADADDGGLASRVEEVFRATVHQVYGDSARPMKPSRVVRREAREYLRAGLSFSELCNVIKEGTRKMAKNGHQAPMCLSALSHNFADALRYLNGARL